MPYWDLELRGTTRARHEPPFLGVLKVIVRRLPASRNGIREVARTSIALPLAFLQLPTARGVFIEGLLARLSVDQPYHPFFAARILRAADSLSNLYPNGFRLIAILDLMTAENSEVEDFITLEDLEQFDSELSGVARGASQSAILGLKEKVCAGEDGESCSICLEDFQRAEKAVELPCSHIFHCPCIFRWLENSNSCPLCRYQFS